jgi:hypothetical protein
MGFEQCHEPAVELSPEVRTFTRMIAFGARYQQTTREDASISQLVWRSVSGPAGIYAAVAGEAACA